MPGKPQKILWTSMTVVDASVLRHCPAREPQLGIRPEAVWLRHWIAWRCHEIDCCLGHVPTATGQRAPWNSDPARTVRAQLITRAGVSINERLEMFFEKGLHDPNVAGGTAKKCIPFSNLIDCASLIALSSPFCSRNNW